MSIVAGVLPYKCPACGDYKGRGDIRSDIPPSGWTRIAYGNEISVSENRYSVKRGIIGGLFGNPAAGWSHSKGSAKSKRIDTYRCDKCGATVPREISTFW